MLLNLESVGERREESKLQSQWEDVHESPCQSFSSLAELGMDIIESIPAHPIKLQMYGQTGCKTHAFNLDELNVGIVKGGSLLGNKLSAATRQENALAGLLLAHINGNDKRGTSEEAFGQFSEMRGTGGSIFDKHEADIMRLLETRSTNDEGPAIRKVQVAQDSQAMIIQNKSSTPDSKNYKLGVMRKPLREIRDQLSSRIKDIKGSREGWEAFEKKICKIVF
jgi:hypothetical protein